MRPARSGEFRLSGTRRGPAPWRVLSHEQIPPAAVQLLAELFTLPSYGILESGSFGASRPARPALVDELSERGYDLGTLRFSIFQRGFGTPRRPRVPPVLPGTLLLRWGWVACDHSPEVCGSHSMPARKADLNLLFTTLSATSFPHRAEGLDYVRTPSNLKRIEASGWDLRTLDFRIEKHADSG